MLFWHSIDFDSSRDVNNMYMLTYTGGTRTAVAVIRWLSLILCL